MTEILFYHLLHQPLERVLPRLLERTLERGWRAVVQAGSREHVEALDALLWTYRDDSFLPHGTNKDGNGGRQPIYLTVDEDRPNGGEVRFLVDGTGLDDPETYERVVYLFDGRDEDALARARSQWKSASEAGHEVTYWQQNAGGRWERKA